ncbi:hypothetical protein DAPPUDRAFT_262284 [Daphnia pulex]|uniref:Uncharacterized protein n=1 Tax=Daphnia pulex TaxID=6669 RepID=E9HMR3_DAPPU|nr:hypothetical protein DAPPUDRAFT_262284 [Daphnia pulex]|eukprot:EFX66952.1 hypothetical protein DAPPUDRAFT_262284 [Daphnia pulex]
MHVAIFSFTIPRGKNSPASKARGKLRRKLFRQALLHRQHIIDREVGFHERAEETTRRIVEQRRQQAAKMNPEMNQPPPLEPSGKEVNIPVPNGRRAPSREGTRTSSKKLENPKHEDQGRPSRRFQRAVPSGKGSSDRCQAPGVPNDTGLGGSHHSSRESVRAPLTPEERLIAIERTRIERDTLAAVLEEQCDELANYVINRGSRSIKEH